MNAKPISTLPARILIQIREGVPNLLADFEIPVYATKPLDPSDPDTIEGAKLGHKIDNRSIIYGLAKAQRKLVRELREQGALEGNLPWLTKLHEWVMSE